MSVQGQPIATTTEGIVARNLSGKTEDEKAEVNGRHIIRLETYPIRFPIVRYYAGNVIARRYK